MKIKTKIKFEEGSIGAHQFRRMADKLGWTGTDEEMQKGLEALHAKTMRKNINRSVRYPGDRKKIDSG